MRECKDLSDETTIPDVASRCAFSRIDAVPVEKSCRAALSRRRSCSCSVFIL